MRQAHSFGVEAVVLRHADYGEADRILTLFTRQLGKTRAIVKGARKVTSRKAGHLEPITHVKLQLAKGRDMPLVTQAEAVETFPTLRENLVLTSQASYVLELVDRFTYDEGIDSSGIFQLLVDTLGRLAFGAEPWMTTRFFEMRFLDELGYRPKLFECAVCGREIRAEDQSFSYAAGGVVCPESAKDEEMRRSAKLMLRPITIEGLRYLRHFQRSDYAEASRAHPAPEIKEETETLMQGFFTHVLERELKTPGFLRRIQR